MKNTDSLSKTIEKLISLLSNITENNNFDLEKLNLESISKSLLLLTKINSDIKQNSINSEPQNELITKIFTNPKALDKLSELIEIID